MKKTPVIPGLSVGTNALGMAVQGLNEAISQALTRMREGIQAYRGTRHNRVAEQGSKRQGRNND